MFYNYASYKLSFTCAHTFSFLLVLLHGVWHSNSNYFGLVD